MIKKDQSNLKMKKIWYPRVNLNPKGNCALLSREISPRTMIYVKKKALSFEQWKHPHLRHRFLVCLFAGSLNVWNLWLVRLKYNSLLTYRSSKKKNVKVSHKKVLESYLSCYMLYSNIRIFFGQVKRLNGTPDTLSKIDKTSLSSVP